VIPENTKNINTKKILWTHHSSSFFIKLFRRRLFCFWSFRCSFSEFFGWKYGSSTFCV